MSSGAYSKVARRIRVPLGFVFAVVYIWLAQPTWISILVGALIVMPGVWLRAIAAGFVKKNAELTTTGPYAYTRNPLYLGSIIIAVGFCVAARNPWIAIVVVALFLAIYLPVIRSEEDFLRATFPGFDEYAARVPRLLPRLTPGAQTPARINFSAELYRKHREYNALIGAAAVLAALIAKMVLTNRA